MLQFAGHSLGVNHLDSKRDGRFFISSSKDQTIKLWDLRVARGPRVAARPRDTSIMRYVGHRVHHTLVRAYFSPAFNTGQRYIVTGSSDAVPRVYDLLTGAVVGELQGHTQIVRDVSWHPHLPLILTASWDGSVGMFESPTDPELTEDGR